MKVVNLARRPFVNERPVVRLAVALWVLGGALLALNIYSYSTYWMDSAEIRGELSQVRGAIDDEKRSIRSLSADFSRVDLKSLNDSALFVNQLIRERTFPWSRLFRDLEEVLPYELRLESVQPVRERGDRQLAPRTAPQRSGRKSRRSSRDEPQVVQAPPPPQPEAVQLNLHGLSKTDDAILNLVDTLYQHPAFLDPNFSHENPNAQTGLVAFDIGVVYLTETEQVEEGDGEATAADTPAADTPAGESTAADTPAAGTPAADRTGAVAEGTTTPAVAGEPAEISRNDVKEDEAATGSRPPSRRSPPPSSEATPKSARPLDVSSAPVAGRPVAGRPVAGRPIAGRPATGTPAAGRPVAGRPVAGTPAAVAPAPNLRPAGGPRASRDRRASREAEPPATGSEETAAPEPEAQERRPEPRFIEPDASGTAPLGGGSR